MNNTAPHSDTTLSQDLASPRMDRVARRQRIGTRRFAFASAFLMLFAPVLALLYGQDKIDGKTLLHAALLTTAFIVTFFVVFRTGINLQFSDPSLTGWQFSV